MGKIAFVFSGQGDQHPGMGLELYENIPEAKAVFEAVEAIRPGTMELCFHGEADALKRTDATQPCMYAMEMAAAKSLEAKGIHPDCVAGFSLGEISALAYSGAVSLEEGFRLVCKRGELMQRDAEKADTGMAAVVKLSDDTVKEICSRFEHVYPVNFNCPGQVSVAGLKSEMADFSAAVKEAKGRAIPLKVAGAFHSPFMAEAAADFGKALENVSFHEPVITLYSNYTSEPYNGSFKDLLSNQICNPVQWVREINNLIASGVDTFIEMGPGKTLCGLIGRISADVRVFCVNDMQTLEAASACKA